MQPILDIVHFLSRALLTCLGNSLSLSKTGSLMKTQSAENFPTILPPLLWVFIMLLKKVIQINEA